MEFLERAGSSDISPFRFFDPGWFRARYAVSGPNAFVSYLQNPVQRLAYPSPLFAPRWYCRRYSLGPSDNPLLDFLAHGDDRDPHPLFDTRYLRDQDATLGTGNVAQNYVLDPRKFRLRSHPLFDGGWYLDRNPDVAAAGVNPLEHYLRFGHLEGRDPNRIFNVRWYRQTYFSRRVRSKIEPLTSYVTRGYSQGRLPAPGLQALAKASIRTTASGLQSISDRLGDGQSIYAHLRHRPRLPSDFRQYMSERAQDYNAAFPEHALLLSSKQVALMYTPKCASAKIVYWWQEQSGLLDVGLKFTTWSHSFENLYRGSRAYFEDALIFEPSRYTIYKFVRDPMLRAVSSFTHFLLLPEFFGVASSETGISFMKFLELLKETNYLGNEVHVRPQLTEHERSGAVSPVILKLEDDLDAHLRRIESVHNLPETKYERRPEIRRSLTSHSKQGQRNTFAGPFVTIPFLRIPDARSLLTREAAEKIYELYGEDFDAYGYCVKMRA